MQQWMVQTKGKPRQDGHAGRSLTEVGRHARKESCLQDTATELVEVGGGANLDVAGPRGRLASQDARAQRVY